MNTIPKMAFFVIVAMIGYIATKEVNNWKDFHFLKSNNQHIDAILQRCPGFCNKKFCKMESSCRPVNRTSKLKRLDVRFHEGVILEAPILFEISTFKKFATQYRPLMYTTKFEVCQYLLSRDHPAFAFFNIRATDGNLTDPCPVSGRRYEFPKYTNTWAGTLVPTGEWRIDFIASKVINGTEEHIATVNVFYLIKAKDATEF